MRLEVVPNTHVWGPIVGRDREFPNLLSYGQDWYNVPRFPGMLVTCHEGELRRMQKRGLNRPGLGIVVGVTPHPEPHGYMQFLCTVVWNW